MSSKLKSLSVLMITFIVLLLTGCNNNAISFEINFDSNGGSIVESVNYDGTSTITIPDNPTKEGFIFDGWFWDNGIFEIPFTANSLLNTPIEDDLTVYAKWVEQDDELTMQLKNIYFLAVQVNAFEGTYEEWLETVRGPQGVPGEDGKPSLLRVSGGVLEWQLEGDSSWTVLYDLNNLAGSDGIDGKNIVLQVSEGYIQWQYTGDLTWTNLVELKTLVGPAGKDGIDGREVLFQVADGYIQWQYTGDTTWTNLIDIATLTGVQGVGIASTSINEYGELIITYTDNTVVNIGTIYKVFTVNFIGLEGYLIDSQTVIYGSDALEPTAPIIEGYTFTGWSQTFTNINANMSINAIYQINTYTVTFVTDGGIAIEPISNIEYNSSIILPIPTKDGYVFMGWYYGEDINSGQFTSQSIVKNNLTLYAIWAIHAYTVTFDSNGGTSVESQVVEDNDKAIKPLDPTKEGYTFDGWYTSQDEGVTLIESWDFAQPIDNSLNLYAKWIINRYTITYIIPPENYNPITDTIIFPGETVDFVALGRHHSLMVSSLGRIFSWGFNRYGQLGNYENIDRDNPVHITGFFDLDSEDYIIQLSLGAYHSAALSNEGKIFLWGYNEKGQLGTGYINNYTTPIDITQRFNLQTEEKIVKVKTGDYNTAAITSLGRLFIWGSSSNSLLADGMTWDRATPYDITSEFNLEANEKIVSVEFGSAHVIALTSSGRVFAWGSNFYGQLGDGTNLKKDYPFEITASFSLTGTDKVIDVYAGSYYSAVLTADGRVFTFGNNPNGQLGDDTIVDKNSPVEITSNFNLNSEDQIITLSLGQYHSSALSLQGMVYFWGDNTFGQLGNNTTVNEKKPLNITDQFSLEIEEKILQVDLGDNHSAVVTSLGNTYFFGINEFGQLGNGSNDDSLIPVSPNIAPTEVIIQEYDYLETISFYSVPSRPGDSFDAWYLNSILTEIFSDNLMPSQDLILFARYDSYAYFAYNQDDYLNPGDQVGYYIYLTRAATIIAYTSGDLDTKGELRDSEENVILFDDDSGEDLNFYIKYTLEPGTYYIYVEGYDDDESGEYQIIIIIQ